MTKLSATLRHPGVRKQYQHLRSEYGKQEAINYLRVMATPAKSEALVEIHRTFQSLECRPKKRDEWLTKEAILAVLTDEWQLGRHVAQKLGCQYFTLRNFIKRYPDIADRLPGDNHTEYSFRLNKDYKPDSTKHTGDREGHTRKMTGEKIELAKQLLANNKTMADISKELGVSVPTIYKWLPVHKECRNG